ncbi:hypothetical protein PIB30_032115 [Stylosanthes scabra]|uniref:Uncharacterized protein n=1 Tax=Stylosanthes scabra TaxID=79078 RepID=A0ABU6UBG9_9FABA|nr:hypothetical protein [Stylosanthes scabra]
MGQKKLVVQGYQNISHTTTTTVSGTTSDLALNPFNEHDHDDISLDIISIHDGHHAVRQDVDSLFSVVSNIVSRSRSTNFTRSLDLKQVTIDLVEEKAADESALRPTYGLLKDIACQITCHSIDKSNAHDSVVGVLKKLKDYTWDAKAVIALSAFALDCGQTWRLSFMQESDKKENAVEMHVFRLAEEEKNPAQSDSTLVDITLKLIEGIITLEKFFANKSYTSSNVPTLSKARRHVYTYWAVFSLFACANQVELGMKNELVGRITSALTQLTTYLSQIYSEIEKWQDLIWRTEAFRIPSGIWQLLKALIYPKNVDHFEIIGSNTSKVTIEDLTKTKYLFLFISGLDNIEEVIESLKSIYNSNTNEGGRKDFQILWVPVVKTWSEQAKEKFESFKSSMPWYVLQYPKPIEGYTVLVEEWDYQDKPIVVVADAFGNVFHKNALHLISLWGLEAFPYDPTHPTEIVFQSWNWFWHILFKIHPPIQPWVTRQDQYIFVYGGSPTWTEEFHKLVEGIKIVVGEETKIEHYNVGKPEEKTGKRFWSNISHSLLSYCDQDVDSSSILSEIQKLLALRYKKEGWAIVSKGNRVFLTGHNHVMLNVLKDFEKWRVKISGSGFEVAIHNYYKELVKPEGRPCMKLKLENIHSRVLLPFRCPDSECGRKMEIISVTYNCCHGKPPSAAADDDAAFEFENGKGPANI